MKNFVLILFMVLALCLSGMSPQSCVKVSAQGEDTSMGFEDLEGFEWAEEAINYICLRTQILPGPSITTKEFMPGEGLSRVNFVVALIRIGITPFDEYAECDFNDVTVNDWFYKYLGMAQKAKIIQGDGNNCFNPNDNISRQDAAVIIANVLRNREVKTTGKLETTFKDSDDIGSYAIDSVKLLESLKIVNGCDGFFEPNRFINRAESCVIIYTTIKYISVIE